MSQDKTTQTEQRLGAALLVDLEEIKREVKSIVLGEDPISTLKIGCHHGCDARGWGCLAECHMLITHADWERLSPKELGVALYCECCEHQFICTKCMSLDTVKNADWSDLFGGIDHGLIDVSFETELVPSNGLHAGLRQRDLDLEMVLEILSHAFHLRALHLVYFQYVTYVSFEELRIGIESLRDMYIANNPQHQDTKTMHSFRRHLELCRHPPEDISEEWDRSEEHVAEMQQRISKTNLDPQKFFKDMLAYAIAGLSIQIPISKLANGISASANFRV